MEEPRGHVHEGLLLLRTDRSLVQHGENKSKNKHGGRVPVLETAACPRKGCLSWGHWRALPKEQCGRVPFCPGDRQLCGGSPKSWPPLESSLAWPLHSPEHLPHHSISWWFTSRPNCLQGKEECEL